MGRSGALPAVAAGFWLLVLSGCGGADVGGLSATAASGVSVRPVVHARSSGIVSVSCASPGSCAAGGWYKDREGRSQAFVVSEEHGAWGAAVRVPGLGALNAGGNAVINSVSCSSAGNCGAGGSYKDASGGAQAFVVAEKRGAWGAAVPVPGLGALNAGGNAVINSVSCSSAGDCSAGGSYTDRSFSGRAFVVAQVRGTWASAVAVHGVWAFNRGKNAQIQSVSCASPGNCAAGGNYWTRSGIEAFVVSDVRGTWSTAEQVRGTGVRRVGELALVDSVSCASAGSCAAGGSYLDRSGAVRAFVVSEKRGTWGTGRPVAGSGPLRTGRGEINSVSCASSGDCAGVGDFAAKRGLPVKAIVVNERNGTWGTARQLTGAALSASLDAEVVSVSCASPGDCAAAGDNLDSSFRAHPFVVTEDNGTWRTARDVTGLRALHAAGNAEIDIISCASPGNCVAAGSYHRSGHSHALVISETNGTWRNAMRVPGL
jgi:hypothetical protein